jgi:putative DNA primase/helicase
VRGLYERTFEFAPQFKLLLAANHRPRARDDDDALWSRIDEVPFLVSIPEAERDPAVKETLCDAAGEAGAAVLAWVVEGAVLWFEQGLCEPEAVRAATRAYREEQDPLTEFLDEHCVLGDPFAQIASKAFRGAYKAWALDQGRRPLTDKALAERLEARGCEAFRRHGGERWWRGIKLREPGDER